jgi:hypothetical protein
LRHVRGRQAVADVGLMGFGDSGKQMFSLEEDRNQERMICSVCITGIGIVVQIAIAFADIPFVASPSPQSACDSQKYESAALQRMPAIHCWTYKLHN